MSQMSFQNLLRDLISQNKAFVVYNFPDSDVLEVLVQDGDTLYTTADFKEKGFVFAPFNTREKTLLLPFDNTKSYTFLLSEEIKKAPEIIPKDFVLETSSSPKEYANIIKKAQKYIQEKSFHKVVLSRQIMLNYNKKGMTEMFIRLLKKHPSAFCYLWQHPKVGMWLGATPEKLLEIKENHLETMALAGTQVAHLNDEIEWGDKEKQEQQFVTDYIAKALSNIKIPIKIGETLNLKAGNLRHICTKITGILSEDISLKVIVESLHPTPAVAGLPKSEAINFILDNEKYNRTFYTGYLGLINSDIESQLFVNLRCMQIKDEKAFVYVGGGITKDSEPEAEWYETEAKSKTLLSLL
jgi:isochorismate synthase